MVTKTSLYKNWIRIASNFIALIPTELFLFLICWKIALGFKSKRLYRSSGKEIQSRCLVLTFWQKNVNLRRIFISRYCSDGKEMYKKAWSSAKLFFVNLSLFLFCRSRCRYCRRRRCLSSLLFINVFALFPSDAFFDLERLESKCGPEGTNASNAF